jgi:hypothetical protein
MGHFNQKGFKLTLIFDQKHIELTLIYNQKNRINAVGRVIEKSADVR